MSDGALSQDEIDALLQGTDDSSFDLDAGGFDSLDDGGSLSQPEIKALQDLINNATANVGDALGAMVEKKITITNPRIEVINSVSLANQLPDQVVEVKMDYEEGIKGEHSYLITTETATVLSGLMMGQNGNELTEASLSAVSEAMNIISGNSSNKIGSKIEKSLKPAAPTVGVKDKNNLSLNSSSEYVKIIYDFLIEGNPSSTLYEIYGLNIVKEILSAIMPASNSGGNQSPNNGMNQGMGNPGMMNNMGQNMMNQGMGNPGMMNNMGQNMMNQGMGNPGMMNNMGQNMMNQGMMNNMGQNMNYGMNQGMMNQNYQQTPVRGVQFPDIANFSADGQESNINLLMDVHMEMTVELGRTKKSIKEILGMGEGTVIELDKLAGEAVDVLVNGQLIAKGEVVVIDENFGVRVTEIINPMDRIRDMT
ncbi:MAG: flagellar motor switch protein FliN [Spirochaetes bacterium GWF1_31_7]|nr:MAG: flagellar motor switch protein FliN [Spirochaetes bacterium GWE1_32_154]OHD45258.1 MAG: flagellar motor switch protein FliN [Spirochaetes bacterium GWE2_31_10]OHD50553.1 MAG: flagellar motor switch protein FliN [Spirochaetes bacterium GWF1_31_7]OHD78573.1 MAG: flagellar motor switch protein FliN [Spirochaetes bacterium RIFOXYB1_FULL_32_8]HBI36569.1 flagellar motor switch phosphatase FliY [Spirochaetia bacterium]